MPSFAETMVAKYEALLQKAVGLREVMVNGQRISYAELEQQYQFWKREAARADGKRPVASNIDLSGF